MIERCSNVICVTLNVVDQFEGVICDMGQPISIFGLTQLYYR